MVCTDVPSSQPWSIGGAKCPAMAQRPCWVSFLFQWRSFKVMMMMFSAAPLHSALPIVSGSHDIIPLWVPSTQVIWHLKHSRPCLEKNTLESTVEKHSRWVGEQRCLHRTRNTAVVLNVLTQERRQYNFAVFCQDKAEAVQRMLTNEGDATELEERQQHKRLQCNAISSSFKKEN